MKINFFIILFQMVNFPKSWSIVGMDVKSHVQDNITGKFCLDMCDGWNLTIDYKDMDKNCSESCHK